MAAPLPPPAPPADDRTPRPDVRRRWPLVAAGVLVLVGAAATAIVLGRGDDAGDDATPGAWNAIAVVDASDGRVTIQDRDGVELDTIATDIPAPRTAQLSPGHVVLWDDGRVAIVDVAAGETMRADVDATEIVRPVRTESGGVVIAGTPQLGNVHVIEVSGTVIDVGDAAGWDDPLIDPYAVAVSADGRRVAASNVRDGEETVVVSFEPDVDALTVAGRVVGIDDDGITVLTGARENELTLVRYDAAGDEVGRTAISPPRGLVPQRDGTVLVVAPDGDIARVDPAADEAESLDSFDDELDDGFRGVLWSNEWSGSRPGVAALETDDGVTVRVVQPDGSVGDEIRLAGSFRRVVFGREPECAVALSDEQAVLIDLGTGTAVATADGRPVFATLADDACVAATVGSRDGDAVLSADGTTELGDRGSVSAISPDGAAVLVRDGAEIVLRPTDDADATDDAELTLLNGGAAHFVEH